MNSALVTPEEFLNSINAFFEISKNCHDTWILHKDKEVHKSYLKKHEFIKHKKNNSVCLLKAEYVIFYNLSYGIPSFSFNMWNNEGSLLKLEEIRQNANSNINEAEFYSVITQQEHPIFNKPYYIVHPCRTESFLSTFKNKSKNIIVTFLSLITPLVTIDMPLEFGL